MHDYRNYFWKSYSSIQIGIIQQVGIYSNNYLNHVWTTVYCMDDFDCYYDVIFHSWYVLVIKTYTYVLDKIYLLNIVCNIFM